MKKGIEILARLGLIAGVGVNATGCALAPKQDTTEKTPQAKETLSFTPTMVPEMFDASSVSKLDDSEKKTSQESQLAVLEEDCAKDFKGFVPGTGLILKFENNGAVSEYRFCRYKDSSGELHTMVLDYNDLDETGNYEARVIINAELLPGDLNGEEVYGYAKEGGNYGVMAFDSKGKIKRVYGAKGRIIEVSESSDLNKKDLHLFGPIEVVKAEAPESTETPGVVQPESGANPTATAESKYSEAQEAVLIRPEVQDRLAKVGYALDAWKVAGGPLEGKNVEVVPIFDNDVNPADATYVIKFADTVNTYYYSLKNGNLQALPTDGMFTLDIPEKSVLSCVDGNYAIRDANGEVMKVINTETGNWIMDKGWVERKFFAGEWPLESDKLIDGSTGKSVELGFMTRGKVELGSDSFENVSMAGLLMDVVVENDSTYVMVGVVQNGVKLIVPVQVVVGGTQFLNRLDVGYVNNSRNMTTNLGDFDNLVGQEIANVLKDHIGFMTMISINLNETMDWQGYGLPDEVVKELVEINNPLTQQNANLVEDLSSVTFKDPLYSIQMYIYR